METIGNAHAWSKHVERAVQNDPALLRYASAITEPKEMLGSLTGSKLRLTTPNNMQQGVQTDATCNTQQCWVLLANKVAMLGVVVQLCCNVGSCRLTMLQC